MVTTGNRKADHGTPTPFALPAGACPSAIAVTGAKLYLADDCQGAVWEGNLGIDGLPIASTYVKHAVTNCPKPSRLAVLSDAAAPAVAVACESSVAFIGRD